MSQHAVFPPLRTAALTGLLLAASLAAAAAPNRSLPAPALGKPAVTRPAQLPQDRLTLDQARDAEQIARNAPDHREGARRLRQRGVQPRVALVALRRAFARPDSDLVPALVAAGYPKPPLVDAIQQTGQLDAAGLDRALLALREPTITRAEHLARLFPTLGAEALFLVLHGNGAVTTDAFQAAHRTRRTPLEALLAEAGRYHQAQRIPVGNGRFFPEAGDAAQLVRQIHPDTPQVVLWARLMANAYSPDAVFDEVPAGAFSVRGIALDAVAGCLAQRFPGSRLNENPKVVLALGVDGRVRHDPGQRQCYAVLLGTLRQHAVPEPKARRVAEIALECQPSSAPACLAEQQTLIETLLADAGYPARKP